MVVHRVLVLKCILVWADPESFVRGVPTLRFFFKVYEGRKDPNTTISVPSWACQQNAIYMAFCWRANDGPTLNAGLVALWIFRGSGSVLLRNPIFLWFFKGGANPMSPSLDPCMLGINVTCCWSTYYSTVQETACTGYYICHAHTCYMSDLINNELVLCKSLSWRVHIN